MGCRFWGGLRGVLGGVIRVSIRRPVVCALVY